MKIDNKINKFLCFINKNKNIVFLLFNLLIGLSFVLFLSIRYETNDDWYLSLISQGYFGNNTYQYMIYSNVILGYILKLFYVVFDSINWYVCFQLILLSLSGYAIWRMLSKKSIWLSTSINLLFWIVILFNAFNSVEFTKTAGIISIVGLFSIYSYIRNKEKGMIVLGFILSILGFFYRNQSFILTLPFVGLIVLFDLIKNYKNNKQKCFKIFKIFGILLISIVLFFVIDKAHYQSDSWKEYTKFNDGITEIFDYNSLPYVKYIDEYKQINYSKNDWLMIMECLNDDVNKFSGDDFATIISQKDQSFREISIKKFIKFLIDDYININNTFLFITLISLSLIVLFNSSIRLQTLLIFLIEACILFYLYYFGRYPDRVLSIVKTCHIVTFIYLLTIADTEILCKKELNKVLIILLVVSLIFMTFKNKRKYVEDNNRFTDIIKNYKNKFVVDISYDNVEIQNDENPLYITNILNIKNCDYIYSWLAGSPLILEDRINKGRSASPYSQILEEGTYLVTRTEKHADMIERYFMENYNSKITKKYIDSIYCGNKTYLIFDYIVLD